MALFFINEGHLEYSLIEERKGEGGVGVAVAFTFLRDTSPKRTKHLKMPASMY